MRVINVPVGPFVGGSHSAISASQSPGTGPILINGTAVAGGVAKLDHARRVVLVSGGNDSTISFKISGTNWAGNLISETLAGVSAGTAGPSVLDYLTVTSIAIVGSGVATTFTAGTAISGTDTPVASSPWVNTDSYGFSDVLLQVDVVGSLVYTVESSLDDPNIYAPNGPVITPAAMDWIAHPVLAAATTTQQSNFSPRPTWSRLTLTTATAATASANYIVSQAGGKLG